MIDERARHEQSTLCSATRTGTAAVGAEQCSAGRCASEDNCRQGMIIIDDLNISRHTSRATKFLLFWKPLLIFISEK